MHMGQSESGVQVELVSADTARVHFDFQELRGRPESAGKHLSDALFGDPAVRDGFLSARASAQTQGLPLRLRLYMRPCAAELHTLAWEALEDPFVPGTALSMAEDVLFSRYDTSAGWRPVQLRPRTDLKALVVVANPAEVEGFRFRYAPFEVDLERERAKVSLRGIPNILLLDPGDATLKKLSAELAEGYDILYLVCHTALSEGEPHLLLEDEAGKPSVVSGAQLVEAWSRLASVPRLVVLVAPNGAVLGPRLLEAGLPAVLAIQGDMPLQPQQEFMSVFFDELLRGGVIDRAVAAARMAIRGYESWQLPALFMRLRSGRLFYKEVTLAPFMAPPPPVDGTPRPAEVEEIVGLLLDAQGQAVTLALKGAGGSGKTFLASAACHDGRVRDAFPEGILWVTVGSDPSPMEVISLLAGLVESITGEPPSFTSLESVKQVWQMAAGERKMLLVVNDLWEVEDLDPFLAGGPRCTRLVTTRNENALPSDARVFEVGAMRPEDAIQLLSHKLPTVGPEELEALGELADRLGWWPMALQPINAVLRDRWKMGQSLTDAIGYVNRSLDRRGLSAFDRQQAAPGQSLARALDLSLELLEGDELGRYLELTAFPEDTNVPLDAVEVLWGAIGGLDAQQVKELCIRFDRLSLLGLDLEAGRLRLHEVLRDYLLQSRVKPGLMHQQLLTAYRKTFELERWADLPRDEPYLWQHLAYHLVGAGEPRELEDLLGDFAWLQTKLEVGGIDALLADYEHLPIDDVSSRTVGDALRLSRSALADDPTQLASQLLGRLSGQAIGPIPVLLKAAEQWRGASWLRPRMASLAPPGGPLLHTLAGHSHTVGTVAVTPDGRHIVSGSWDRTVRVWDLESGTLLRIMEGHTEGVTGVFVTRDARHIISASKDGTLKVWSLVAGTELRSLQGHAMPIEAVAATPDGKRIISASGDGTLRVWDLELGIELHVLEGHDRPVTAVAVTPDGEYAVSASADRTLRVWDIASGRQVLALAGHDGPVTAVAVMPDGRHSISTSHDQTLRVWDMIDGRAVSVVQAHSRGGTGVAVTSDGQYAISTSLDQSLRIWDLAAMLQASPSETRKVSQETGMLLATLHGHTEAVTAVTVTPDGRQIVSGSDDQNLVVWDLERALEVRALAAHADAIHAVAVLPSRKQAISASADATLKVWDLEGGQVLYNLEGHMGSVNAVAVTSDGKRALSTSFDQTLRVWNLEFDFRGQVREHLDAWADRQPSSVRSQVDRLKVLRAVERELLSLGLSEPLTTLAVTPDGQRLVAAGWDKTLKVWELDELLTAGSLLDGDARQDSCLDLHGHSDLVRAVAVSADGRQALTGAEDGALILWDLDEGRNLGQLLGHGGTVYSVVLFEDGRRALSTSADRTLKVWDLESFQELASLCGHERPVVAVGLSPDGRWVVTASEDQTLKAWNLSAVLEGGTTSEFAVSFSGEIDAHREGGVLLATFTADSPFHTCTVSPDDSLIVAGDRSGHVHFLQLIEVEKD
jgi:WD40 repeat protein